MAYFPEAKNGNQAYFILGGARRIAATDRMGVPPALSEQRMEIYISVIAEDRKQVSYSEYLGRLNG